MLIPDSWIALTEHWCFNVMKKNPDSKASQMPFRMKTVVFDEFAFPFPGNDSQIRCVLRFNGKTDEKRLLRAIRLVYDAEPILGCRFVNHLRGYYWQRFDQIGDLVPNVIVETDHMESAVNRFLLQPLDPLTQLPFQVRLLRKDHDVLCFKLCHMVSDAGGLKDILYLLSDIYEKLKTNPDFIPDMNRSGDRGFMQVYKHFSLADRLRIIKRGVLNWKSDTFPGKTWTFPLVSGDIDDKGLIVKHFDRTRFKAFKSACSSYNCTFHELFTVAVLRTLNRIIAPPPDTPLRLGTSVDLRRYIPGGNGEAIGNLSTFFHLNIGTDIGTNFEDTVKQVQQTLHPLKNDFLGLGFYQPRSIYLKGIIPSPWARWLFNRMIRCNQWLTSGTVCPRLTNTGIIDEKQLKFDHLAVSDCYIAPPICHPPIFMPVLSGFRETLTLCIGFSEASKNRMKMNDFINLLDDELKQLERKD